MQSWTQTIKKKKKKKKKRSTTSVYTSPAEGMKKTNHLKMDAKRFCWPEVAGWKKELLTINMAVSRRGIGRPEISCHSHQNGQKTHLLETWEGDKC